MAAEDAYPDWFYKALQEGARRSARVIVPLVMDLLRPKSVIDVGCGLGAWLSVFGECGVDDLWGIDGDHVERSLLEIPQERFISFDLTHPVQMDRTFELVVSLEVGEHLPNACAEAYVNSLTSLGPCILFSAAVPFQKGRGHVNEQWPEYWAQRFSTRDYIGIDCVRRRVWQNDEVEWWYKQNVVLYAHRATVDSHPELRREYESGPPSPMSVVHPDKYLDVMHWALDLKRQLDEEHGESC